MKLTRKPNEAGKKVESEIHVFVVLIPRSMFLFIFLALDAQIGGHTGCPRRNVPDFGRVFLMLNYTDITQNTYVQSRTVTEIMAREKCGLHWCRSTLRCP